MGSCSIFNGRVGMTVTDNEIYRIIVDIMDIQNEPENIFELDNWIRQIGLQEVYIKKSYRFIPSILCRDFQCGISFYYCNAFYIMV